MGKINKIVLVSFLAGILTLVGCEDATETVNKVAGEVEETIQAEATKDNEFVLSVKGGTLQDYPEISIEEAFAYFFSSPTWKYFEAETGEHVVEFTGYCTYMEKKVKAKLQFLVEEGVEIFEIGALEFNEVPQNNFTKVALLEAIYEPQVVEGTKVVSSIGTPFQIGAHMDELTSYYGDPTYDDYYMGGRLLVFNDEDGYFVDEGGIVTGFMIGNPEINIFGTYVGMTPSEISDVLSEPFESYYDDMETQSYVKTYYIDNFAIYYHSDEENGPTTSALILVNEENLNVTDVSDNPYEWSLGIKEQFETDMVASGYVDSVANIRYEESGIYGDAGYYAVYTVIDGEEFYVVSVNVKTGDYHG